MQDFTLNTECMTKVMMEQGDDVGDSAETLLQCDFIMQSLSNGLLL